MWVYTQTCLHPLVHTKLVVCTSLVLHAKVVVHTSLKLLLLVLLCVLVGMRDGLLYLLLATWRLISLKRLLQLLLLLCVELLVLLLGLC